MVTVFHHASVIAIMFFKKNDWLHSDGLAEKCQKHQIFPCQNFTLYGIVAYMYYTFHHNFICTGKLLTSKSVVIPHTY